jgi:hypothetical protein
LAVSSKAIPVFAQLNCVPESAHHDGSMEMLAADFLAARQETLDLLQQFTDVLQSRRYLLLGSK